MVRSLADRTFQPRYEDVLAAGYSYEQALAEGQAALNAAEADYDTMLADQQVKGRGRRMNVSSFEAALAPRGTRRGSSRSTRRAGNVAY